MVALDEVTHEVVIVPSESLRRRAVLSALIELVALPFFVAQHVVAELEINEVPVHIGTDVECAELAKGLLDRRIPTIVRTI
jgi:hypothetical protein